MGEVATIQEQSSPTIHSLKPAVRQWLKRSARILDPTDIEFDAANPPAFPESARPGVERAAAEAKAAMQPCRPEEAMEILAKLEITMPRRKMSEAESRVFWSDLRRDTSGMSAWALSTACDRYRSNPENRFFPKGAELRALVGADMEAWQEIFENCQKILNYTPPEPKDDSPYMTPERLEQIRKEMG